MGETYIVESDAIMTRNRAQEISREARQMNASAIDLSKVEFISRSVADELVHQRQKHEFSLIGQSPDIEKMISMIESGE